MTRSTRWPAFYREVSRRWTTVLAATLVLAATAAGLGVTLPPAVDWHAAFRPAALSLMQGRSPYLVEGFFNAPWILIPLIPAALLPEQLGRGLLALASIAALAFTARRLGANWPAVLLILLSPPAIHGLLNGSLDGLLTLAFVSPPWLGLILLVAKPQIGIAVAVFWGVEAWRTDRSRGVLRFLWPTTLLLGISLLAFGAWPLRAPQEIALWWNASLWPASIPLGMGLLAAALWKRRLPFAIAASPFLSPYVLLHSWVVELLALSAHPWLLGAAVAGLWCLTLVRFATG